MIFPCDTKLFGNVLSYNRWKSRKSLWTKRKYQKQYYFKMITILVKNKYFLINDINNVQFQSSNSKIQHNVFALTLNLEN